MRHTTLSAKGGESDIWTFGADKMDVSTGVGEATPAEDKLREGEESEKSAKSGNYGRCFLLAGK